MVALVGWTYLWIRNSPKNPSSRAGFMLKCGYHCMACSITVQCVVVWFGNPDLDFCCLVLRCSAFTIHFSNHYSFLYCVQAFPYKFSKDRRQCGRIYDGMAGRKIGKVLVVVSLIIFSP